MMKKTIGFCVLGLVQAVWADFTNLKEWNGLNEVSNTGEASLTVPGVASYTYPDGEKGWHRVGLGTAHDGSGNWCGQYGVRFDLYLPNDKPLKAVAELDIVPRKVNGGSEDVIDTFSSKLSVAGKGWHTVTVPFDSFDLQRRVVLLETIKTFRLKAAMADGSKANVKLENPRVVKADIVSLDSEIRSVSAKGGETVTYTLELSNCTDVEQLIDLSYMSRGRETMTTEIVPAELTLAPGESATCQVNVAVSSRVAPGGHEKQLIRASANGKDAGTIEYTTVSYLEHPYILFTKEGWDAIRKKAETVEWAKEAAQEYIAKADNWTVPALNKDGISRSNNQVYLYSTYEEKNVEAAAIAYQLTGDEKYAEKVALFLRQLSDPEEGYPKTNQGCNASLVQEGHFFQRMAIAYDLIYNSAALSEEDHTNIAHTFRLYQKIIDSSLNWCITGNWRVSMLTGAAFSALAIQDLHTADRFITGSGGMVDQFRNGVMSDGWWYECSISYNTWVASEFTQLALALQPFGYDYVDAAFPATYSKEYNVFSVGVEERKKQVYGKPFQKWGPVHKPFTKIKNMWDALPPFIDYNGVMVANNDSLENKFKENYYEIAYYVYRDPTYAAIIKNLDQRDLLYGVVDLPENTPELGVGSAFADNAGQAMLRSTQEEPAERIQAVLKYGSHGGYHGHFDRTALNSMMRYGRSFYNPEHIWYGYPNFMYAFFVQTSLPHNMVVVDMKQQEAVESSKLFFSTNELMQVTAVETKARWSNPPYGGLNYEAFDGTFQEKCWAEGRYMPLPENEPVYGSIGEWSTDRVTQRRMMLMTDDYFVLADYLSGDEEHTYDCLFNIKGFQGLEAEQGSEPVRHTEQMNPDPILAAQLITDCSWYDAKGTAKVSFETKYGDGADNEGTRIYGEDGVLKMDVYSAWPRDREVMIGALPESHRVNRKFWYTVKGDDQTLVEGKFGAWVLGRDEIDVSVAGMKTLTLVTKTDARANAKKTLFWGNPVIVTKDGNEIALSDLGLSFDQIRNDPESGVDYYGGPVKIAGKPFAASVPANPVKENVDGTITLDLSSLNAVRFKAQVGGDYPLGNEAQRRKSLSFRTTGKQAQYLTLIEPFETESIVEKVTAQSANQLTVELKDGRTHKISFQGLEKGQDIKVMIQEFRDGKLIRQEAHSE
ncbi:heparinase II/III family protein [Pontiellaceae bacterium B12219]|nr:heparinase II/III family protein [Pontiellaceae bacterium B12219]